MSLTKRILLIDDDEDDRALFADAVKDVDCSADIICCEGGKEALQFLQEDNNLLPDYIFLDINMPCISGKKCLVEIKKMQRLVTTPVYMYSTSNSSKENTELKQLGATDFFTKPSCYADLLQLVSSAIS